MKQLIPHPILSLCLILMWLMLTSFSLGHLILGTVVALLAGRAMSALQPEEVRIRRWGTIPRLCVIMAWDVAKSNYDVAHAIVTGRARNPGFVSFPLSVESRAALSILAIVITATPGTAWVAFDTRTRMLTLHALDRREEGEWERIIKGRYEPLLREIFE